jgi:hypothetical protein
VAGPAPSGHDRIVGASGQARVRLNRPRWWLLTKTLVSGRDGRPDDQPGRWAVPARLLEPVIVGLNGLRLLRASAWRKALNGGGNANR